MSTRGWESYTPTDAARRAMTMARRPIAGATGALAGRSKYGAVRTVVDGRSFASKAEALRYVDLAQLAKAGLIHDLELQPVYPLIVAGVTVGKYLADFRYYREDGELVVEDVKGMATPTYRLKRRIVEALYGIRITEIR